jgi:ketosteroid isomerase-like protein
MKHSRKARFAFLGFLTVSLSFAQSDPAIGGTDALKDEIVAQERAGLEALKTGDLTAFANSTADDAIFVDAAGPAGKEQVMKNVAGFRLREYSITDIRFVALSADSGLIAYRVAESGTSHGKDFAANVFVSALWVRRGGKWMCVFSQETAAR